MPRTKLALRITLGIFFFFFLFATLRPPEHCVRRQIVPPNPRNTPKSPSSSSFSPSSSWSWSPSIAHLACTRQGRYARGMRVAVDHPKGVRPNRQKGPGKSVRPDHRPPPPTRLRANHANDFDFFLRKRYSKIINACKVTGPTNRG